MTDPRWLEIARREIGVHETPGPGTTSKIVEYDAVTTLKAKDDAVAWCSSFVCWCIEQAGIRSTRSAAAISWMDWGTPCDPKPGAITVIRHKAGPDGQMTGSGSGNHVGFWVGSDLAHVKLLGGNQLDSVRESLFPLDRYGIIGYRWPLGGTNGQESVRT